MVVDGDPEMDPALSSRMHSEGVEASPPLGVLLKMGEGPLHIAIQ
jgi:hypothetical protein